MNVNKYRCIHPFNYISVTRQVVSERRSNISVDVVDDIVSVRSVKKNK